MTLASRIADRFRKKLRKLVDKERKLVGCGTTAVKRIASKIGMSVPTLYRAMNGYGAVQIHAHHYIAVLMVLVGPKLKRRKPAAAVTTPQPEYLEAA